FSRANPQRLFLPAVIDPEDHFEKVNVEAQQNNPNSLLWWTKRFLALRKRHRAFGRGDLQVVRGDNARGLAFVGSYRGENRLVVANLSRSPQHVQLDLGGFAGLVPLELLGQSRFPAVTAAPYPLALGPHSFYWFDLEPSVPATLPAGAELPVLTA